MATTLRKKLNVYKLNELPSTFDPEAFYFIKNGSLLAEMYIGSEDGLGVRSISGGVGLFKIINELESIGQLPSPVGMADGYGYLIAGHAHVIFNEQWIDVGNIQGPEGPPGIGIYVMGTLPSASLLPEDDNVRGNAWIADGQLWVWDGTRYSPIGVQGIDGKDAYQIAVDNGFVGTKSQWLQSLKGLNNYQLAQQNGFVGTLSQWLETQKIVGPIGEQGIQGLRGIDGKSAYQVAVENGFVGTAAQWVASLKGDPAVIVQVIDVLDSVDDLPLTANQNDGYIIDQELHAYINGDWVNLGNIVGPPGVQGIQGNDAYEVAVQQGFTGDRVEWLESLKGRQGDQGVPGPPLIPMGELNDEADLLLVQNPENGWFYNVAGQMYVYYESVWMDMGRVVGENGLGAYEQAVQQGFTGDITQWLASLKGNKGDKGNDGTSAYQLAVSLGFVGTPTQWIESLKGEKGDPGDSAYQVALDNGFVGTAADWLLSIKGQKGDRGINFVPKGYRATLAELDLLPVKEPGDSYVVGEGDFYSHNGQSFVYMGNIRGTQGIQGPIGPGLAILDVLENESELPATGTLGQGYMIGLDYYAWNGTTYVNAGPLKGDPGEPGIGLVGPPGRTAYEVAVDNGFIGTVGEWLISIKGDKGNDAYQVAVEEGYVGSKAQWLLSLKGDKGDPGVGIQGDPGRSIYDIAVDNGFTGTEAELLESFKGDPGIQGIPGLKGDQGSLWIIQGRDPVALDGRSGDLFLNSSSLAYFRKVSGVAWAFLGYLGGGNVYDATQNGIPHMRQDGQWIEYPDVEGNVPSLRVEGGWVNYVAPTIPVLEAPNDADPYMRKGAQWVAYTEAPATGDYVRRSTGWTRLDRYDLRLNTVTSSENLDLSTCTNFRFTLSGNRVVSFLPSSIPASTRTMTLVFTIKGNSGVITWPASVLWHQGVLPEYGATSTTIVMYWDGTNWIANQGATI